MTKLICSKRATDLTDKVKDQSTEAFCPKFVSLLKETNPFTEGFALQILTLCLTRIISNLHKILKSSLSIILPQISGFYVFPLFPKSELKFQPLDTAYILAWPHPASDQNCVRADIFQNSLKAKHYGHYHYQLFTVQKYFYRILIFQSLENLSFKAWKQRTKEFSFYLFLCLCRQVTFSQDAAW